MKFTKMQGCGNDYVYINCFEEDPQNPEELAIKLSDRHFGIGGDGVIFIRPSKVADCMMDMYNLDGSRGRMCGNGIRCVGKYAYDHGIVDKTEITVETLSGIKTLTLFPGDDGKIEKVRVDMGTAEFRPEMIPLNTKALAAIPESSAFKNGECVKNIPVTIKDKTFGFTFVSMGNPHAVTFIDDTKTLDIVKYGPEAEVHELFPEKANIEFIKVNDASHIDMRVWERGSGETFACGTGACAAAVAAVLNGYSPLGEDITVRVRGGTLHVCYTGGSVLLTGETRLCFEGSIEI